MPEFKYTVSDAKGVISSKTILAENADEVKSMLAKDSLSLIFMQELPEARETLWDRYFHPVSNDDKAQFLEYFASMLESGLSVSDVLQAFYEDLDKPLLRQFIKDTQYGVRNGKKLSECFGDYPQLFPKLYVGMLEVGEASGTLAASLKQLSVQLKKSNEIKSKVRNAMIYPAIIITALTIVVVGMLVVVFPKLEEFFGDSNMELPAFTQMFLNISHFMTGYWYIILATIAIAILLYRNASRTSHNFRVWRSKFMLRVPIFGNLNKTTNVAIFSRTLGSLLSSGVHILESLEVVQNSLSNQIYIDIVEGLKADVAKGNSLADSMKKYPNYFNSFEIRVISISDRTGTIAEGLLSIADFYETRLYGLLAGVSSAMEPLLLIFMGGMVVSVALAVITPIYQLLSNVNSV